MQDPPDERRSPTDWDNGDPIEKRRESLETRLDRLWSIETPGASQQFADRYIFHRCLGAGAFGIVYLAMDSKTEQLVAIKLPRPEVLVSSTSLKRFSEEAQLIGQLDHPHLVRLLAAETNGPTPYIVTEYCDGPDLGHWSTIQTLDNRPLPTWQEAARLLATIANAVHVMHAQGITHRDLKPSNVLLCRQSDNTNTNDTQTQQNLASFTPKVSDFGLSRLNDKSLKETRSSVILGTPIYMAPELLSPWQQKPNDCSDEHQTFVLADIYGLGAILFELLTGHPPVNGESYFEILENVRSGNLIRLHELRDKREFPATLQRVCDACLHKNPKGRYSNAASLAADLERCLDDQPAVGTSYTAGQHYRFWHHQQSWLATSGRFALASTALIAAWMILTTVGAAYFNVVTPTQYWEIVRQSVSLLITTTFTVGLAGWLCVKGKLWGAWIGAGLCGMNIAAASFGLRGDPLVFRDLYLNHNLYLSFTVHLFVTLCYASQLMLFIFALWQRPIKKLGR